MQSFLKHLQQLKASENSVKTRSQKPHNRFSRMQFPIKKGGRWISQLLLLGTVMTGSLTGAANAVPVTHLTTQTATATGAGAAGTPGIATFNIPSGKNRVLFIWATFERDHCSNADVTANRCVNGNTAGTDLGDNYPEPRIGTAPATTSNNQLTARVVGPGGTINKQNALVIGGTPSGDTRFINISQSPSGSPAGTAYFSVSSFHIVLFENEINTLLGGAASGTVSITLPDTIVPSNAGDDAMLLASVFQNVEQTPTGFVRNATATAQVTTGTPGNSSLAPAAYDAGQAPDEADDGKLVMGANSSTEGFLLPAGHVALATLSVTNAGGNYDTPNGNANNEPNGLTGGAYFRNGGATPGSLYTLQMGGAASTLVYGATNASFLLESDSSDAGDAPLSYGNPTHTIVNGLRLGASVDADAGFLNSSNATGDDTNGTDDENGVTIPTLTQGQSATISVNVNQVTAGTGRLQGWIDWNGDGDFADAGEQIATNLQLSAGTSGTISVPVTVPAGAITSAPTFARFRWSTTADLSSTPTATNGEVEDYQVSIVAAAPVNAKVLLVKRITAINGDRVKNPNDPTKALNQVLNNPATVNDDAGVFWPSGFLVGAYQPGLVQPGDVIEYTVYFLNAQGANASEVRVCDRIVGEQQFVSDAYGVGQDIEYQLGTSPNPVQYLTKASLTSVDRGELNVSTGTIVGCPAPSITGNNNGTVIVDVTSPTLSTSTGQVNIISLPGATAPGTPISSYGYFRFKAKVNP
jgi:uncharacterized repeat protein (TIGR01451 family)